jgi:hypothetical protein
MSLEPKLSAGFWKQAAAPACSVFCSYGLRIAGGQDNHGDVRQRIAVLQPLQNHEPSPADDELAFFLRDDHRGIAIPCLHRVVVVGPQTAFQCTSYVGVVIDDQDFRLFHVEPSIELL